LIDELVIEQAVTRVYRGRRATHHTAPHIPHEGFLADFLMRNKDSSAARSGKLLVCSE
jgi:hypothetical protein